MAFLNSSQFLSAASNSERFKPLKLELTDFGTVYVRKLKSSQVDEYAESMRKAGPGDARALILMHAVCDDYGNPMFTINELPALRDIDGSVANAIVASFQKLNALVTAQDDKS